jgi:hypothetical protein
MGSERGQASVEWTAVVAVVALALAAAAATVPAIDGRSVGSWLAHSILCAMRGGCHEADDRALEAAYGERDAALVRRFAPSIVYEPGTHTLPVDFRRCRSHRCADAPDDPSLEVTRSTHTRTPAAAFTHVVHRDGETFIQYWLYYPDSNTVLGPSSAIWNHSPAAWVARYPGWHADDWESFQVRVDAAGRARVRASAHHGYQGCKERQCHNRWIEWTGWTRVSKGSHAGHIPYETEWAVARSRRRGPAPRRVASYRPLYPGRDLHERTTPAAAVELVPIETLPPAALGMDFGKITPPWRKAVYGDPLSDSTS